MESIWIVTVPCISIDIINIINIIINFYIFSSRLLQDCFIMKWPDHKLKICYGKLISYMLIATQFNLIPPTVNS